MEIRSRNSDPSRYSVTVQVGGQAFFGLLTYDLLRPELNRNVVLLNAEAISNTLSEDQKKALETLRHFLNDSYKLDAEGRIAQAKSLVRMIANGTVNYPGKAIVVHRFGPVPALAIDTDLTHVLPDGKELKGIRLAVFPGNDNRAANRLLFPPGSPSTVHFLESLKLDMPVLFRRYFEDAAEILWAIQHKADLAKALSWAKAVETGIGESVKTKLDTLLPEMLEKRSPKKYLRKHTMAQTVRTEQPWVVLQAAYGRLLVLYLINCLYELVGIRPETKYRDRLDSFVDDYAPFFSLQTVLNAFEDDEALHDLKAVKDSFDSSMGVESPEALPDVRTRIHWIEKVAQFGRFLAVLRKRGASDPSHKEFISDPGFAKIFFSSVHLIPSGVEVFNALKTTLQQPQSRAVLLSVQEPADAGFRELILARLWLSDALLALVPRQPRRFDGSQANYGWIATESALALLTNRRVSFALESGVTVENVAQDFSKDFSKLEKDLLEWADHDDAASQLKKYFDTIVRGEYTITDPARPLDDRLKKQVDNLVNAAIQDRTDKLVRGFLDQFPPELLFHSFVLRQAKSGVQSSWMAAVLKDSIKAAPGVLLDDESKQKKATQKFYSLYAEANARALVINGRVYPLMSDDKQRKKYKIYYWLLPQILHDLRPSATAEEIDRWETELLTAARRKGEEMLRRRQAPLPAV